MLPQFGFTEFIMIAIVALVVVGPQDLPKMMRQIGKIVAKARLMANEFRSAFDDIAREAELDELQKEIEELRRQTVKEATDEMRDFEREMNDEVIGKSAKAAPDLDEGKA